MQDIVERLKALPHPVTSGPAGPEVAAADLARGRRALVRRRRYRIARSTAAVAAVAAVTVGVSQFTNTDKPGHSAAGGSGATTQSASRIQLVDFTGVQPVGFKVSTIPAGWQVISSDKTAFVVAPPGSDASEAVPLVAQDGASGGLGVSFDGRIVVMLQGMARLPSDSSVTKVSINGKDGVLGRAAGSSNNADEGTMWLMFADAAGNKVLVQVPMSLGLTNDQIVRFAEGITVTSDAHSVGG